MSEFPLTMEGCRAHIKDLERQRKELEDKIRPIEKQTMGLMVAGAAISTINLLTYHDMGIAITAVVFGAAGWLWGIPAFRGRKKILAFLQEEIAYHIAMNLAVRIAVNEYVEGETSVPGGLDEQAN